MTEARGVPGAGIGQRAALSAVTRIASFNFLRIFLGDWYPSILTTFGPELDSTSTAGTPWIPNRSINLVSKPVALWPPELILPHGPGTSERPRRPSSRRPRTEPRADRCRHFVCSGASIALFLEKCFGKPLGCRVETQEKRGLPAISVQRASRTSGFSLTCCSNEGCQEVPGTSIDFMCRIVREFGSCDRGQAGFILRAVVLDAFEMPGVGLDVDPCRRCHSAGFCLQFEAEDTICARADHAERPAKCLEMSRVQGLGADKMSRFRAAPSDNSVHRTSFNVSQQGCEGIQAIELYHDAHMKASTMSHTWPRKV